MERRLSSGDGERVEPADDEVFAETMRLWGRSLQPRESRPVCAICKKEIPPGETVYEIRGYTGVHDECANCFRGEGR